MSLLLSLAMVSQAWAVLPAGGTPCPMAAEMAANVAAAVAGGEPVDETLDDCCNDVETFLRTGQACQPAPECQAPVLGLVQAAPQARPLPPAMHVEAMPVATPPSGALAPIWRPPTRL